MFDFFKVLERVEPLSSPDDAVGELRGALALLTIDPYTDGSVSRCKELALGHAEKGAEWELSECPPGYHFSDIPNRGLPSLRENLALRIKEAFPGVEIWLDKLPVGEGWFIYLFVVRHGEEEYYITGFMA